MSEQPNGFSCEAVAASAMSSPLPHFTFLFPLILATPGLHYSVKL